MNFIINQRVDLLPLIVTAFAILFFIKLSSYILPAGYYFSVSSIFRTDTEFMLVQDQGLPTAKLCELMKRNYILPEDIDRDEKTCNELQKIRTSHSWGASLTKDEREEIYETWVIKRPKIEAVIENEIIKFINQVNQSKTITIENSTDVQENEDQEISLPTINQIEKHQSYGLGYDEIYELQKIIQASLQEEFLFLEDKYTDSDNQGDENTVEFEGIPLQIDQNTFEQLIISAKKISLQSLQNKSFEEILSHPKRELALSKIDEMYDPTNITEVIVSTYLDEFLKSYNNIIRRYLVENGLPIVELKQNISNLKKEILYENLPSYITSAFIRMIIVFVAVSSVVLVFLGRYEISSYAFGGAFAGLLLTWPIISLWDIAVNSDWQSMRGKFLIIYIIYIMAFFYTAKLATLVVYKLSDTFKKNSVTFKTNESETINISLKELTTNLSITLLLNFLAYGANLIVPFNG